MRLHIATLCCGFSRASCVSRKRRGISGAAAGAATSLRPLNAVVGWRPPSYREASLASCWVTKTYERHCGVTLQYASWYGETSKGNVIVDHIYANLLYRCPSSVALFCLFLAPIRRSY
jgi:hypothetical protein